MEAVCVIEPERRAAIEPEGRAAIEPVGWSAAGGVTSAT